MTDTRRPAPRPRPRHARPDDEAAVVGQTPTTAPARDLARCNLTGCDELPEWRGLCSAHRQTHRGLADPKETR